MRLAPQIRDKREREERKDEVSASPMDFYRLRRAMLLFSSGLILEISGSVVQTGAQATASTL